MYVIVDHYDTPYVFNEDVIMSRKVARKALRSAKRVVPTNDNTLKLYKLVRVR